MFNTQIAGQDVSLLCCIAAKLREQSVMKILLIADPWLKEREENSTRLSVFISPSHAVTRKGYLITLYRPSHWESNVTTLHQDEQSTSTSFFVVLWHWLPAILRGVWRCPFLWPHQFLGSWNVIHWKCFIIWVIIWCINIQITLQSGSLNCAAEPTCRWSIH